MKKKFKKKLISRILIIKKDSNHAIGEGNSLMNEIISNHVGRRWKE